LCSLLTTPPSKEESIMDMDAVNLLLHALFFALGIGFGRVTKKSK